MPKLLGEKLQAYVLKQMGIRQFYHGTGVSKKRTPLQMSILNSKTAWVKLASGLEIDETRLREENLQDRFIGRALAREHVLFSGISSLDQENDKLIQRGTVPPNNLFSSINGVYTVNPTNNPYTGFGAVPMPGIESIDVKALNRGSIKETTVKISAYSPEQFKVIDLLYLRIGYTVFLEWGWSHYVDNNTFKLGNDIVSFIDSKEGWFKENYWNKDGGGTNEILNQVINFRRKYSGNWDGFLGRVKNFSWTIDENGKYDITLKLISLGDVIESLKCNLSPNSDVLAAINQGYAIFLKNNDSSATNVTDISRVTNSLSSYIVLNLLYIGAQNPKTGQPNVNLKSDPPANIRITSYWNDGSQGFRTDTGGLGGSSTKLRGFFLFDSNSIHAKSMNQITTIPSEGWFDGEDDLSKQIQKKYPGAKKIDNFVDWQNTTTPGTYWTPFIGAGEQIAGLVGADNQLDAVLDFDLEDQSEVAYAGAAAYLKVVTTTEGLIASSIDQKYTDVAYFNYNMGENKGAGEVTVNEKGLYMRLGHILNYINKYIIPYINNNKPNKLINIDTVSDTNYMYISPYYMSYDPRVCVVNGRIKFQGHTKRFGKELPPFRVPSDTDIFPINIYGSGYFLGYTMNIYMNCSYIMQVLNSNIDKKGDINIYKFLTEICNGINKSMGGVNNLEPVVDEEQNIINIIDGSLTTPQDKNKNVIKVLGYGKTKKGTVISNFVKDFSIKTELTNNFATMAAVGSTAAGYSKGTENTMFSKWNKGLTDPFKEKLDIEQDTKTKETLEEKVLDELDPVISYKKTFLSVGNSAFGLTSPQNAGESWYEAEVGDQPALADEIIDKNLPIATEFWKWYQSYLHQLENKYVSSTNGFIPISLDLTLEGISGIKIYNSINVDTAFLPSNYTKNLNFIIKNVDHSLKDGNWETKLSTIVVANSNYSENEDGSYSKVFTQNQQTEALKNIFQNKFIDDTIALQDKKSGEVTYPAYEVKPTGTPANVNPDEVCGLASANTVNEIYPRSVKWRKGPQPVIIPISKSPSVAIDLLAQPTKKFERTYVSYSEYKKAATKVIKQISPSINSSNLKKVVTAALAVSIIEQGSGDKIKGFNNNLTGVESSGFKVFKKSDVNGKVFATEGGTGLKKAYYSFKSVEAGLVPLISKIIQRNMFAQNGEANEFAWRYYRDWNGYGARTKTTYSGDCAVISRIEKVYAKAAANV